MSATIESAPTVEAVEDTRQAIRSLLAESDGRMEVPALLERLHGRGVTELAQTYAFGVMLSRNEVVVEDDTIALADLEDEPSDADVG